MATTVYLINTDFDDSGKDLLLPSDKTPRGFLNELLGVYSYKEFNNVTWERVGQTFRCPVKYDELKQYNYMAYINDSRLEFAYIVQYQYVNNKLTYVDVSIDYWATYIDKFEFRPSPIVRQHPGADGLFANWFPETPQIDRWEITRTDYGNASEDDDNVFLLTANNTDTYKNRSSDFYGAIANFALGDSSQISNFFSTVEVNPCSAGGLVQSNTSHVSRSGALDIVKQYAKCGRQEDIVGAYHIPKYFASDTTGENLSTIANKEGNLELYQEYEEKPLWNKIYTSPQYNRLSVNNCGSCKEYDFRYFGESSLLEKKYTFSWSANQSQLGGVAIAPNDYGNGTNGDYALTSPAWDSVQLSTTQLNTAGIARDTGNFAIATVGNILSLDIKGEIQDAATYAENMGSRYEESDITIGTPAGTIAMYNALFPFISIAWYRPSLQDIKKLNNYFCMYGYNYNGSLAQIETNSLPICNYVHTSGAVVVAKDTPQVAIAYMINRLDSGVWFWHTVDNYKRTDKILENHFEVDSTSKGGA